MGGFYPARDAGDAEGFDSKRNQDDNEMEPLPKIQGKGERIEKSTLKPMNDPKCAHQWVDDDEVIGNMRAQTCKFCPLGRWVRNTA